MRKPSVLVLVCLLTIFFLTPSATAIEWEDEYPNAVRPESGNCPEGFQKQTIQLGFISITLCLPVGINPNGPSGSRPDCCDSRFSVYQGQIVSSVARGNSCSFRFKLKVSKIICNSPNYVNISVEDTIPVYVNNCPNEGNIYRPSYRELVEVSGGHDGKPLYLVSDERCNYIKKIKGREQNQDPVARCNISPNNPKVGERVTCSGSSSYDPDGYIDTYRWDLDDYGDTDEYGETVYHSFPDSGYHEVELEVEDNDGATDSTTCSVRVEERNEPPTARCSVDPREAAVGESVDFDGTDSYDSDGRIKSYWWDLDGDGDNDAFNAKTSHGFDTPGRKRTKLYVKDNAGATDSTTCTVRVKEKKGRIHVITSDTTGEIIDAQVYIDDEYRGRTGSDGFLIFDGLDPKRYEVRATKSGYKSAEEKVYLTSGEKERLTLKLKKKNQPPNARFSYSPANPKQDEQVDFDASNSNDPDGNIDRYEWDLDGDGNTDNYGKTPSFSFSNAGTHHVKLTVTDDDGAKDYTTQEIEVKEKTKKTNLKIDKLRVFGGKERPKQFKPEDMFRVEVELKNDGPIEVDSSKCTLILTSIGKSVKENFHAIGKNSSKTKTINWYIPEGTKTGDHQGLIVCKGESDEGVVRGAAKDLPPFEIIEPIKTTEIKLIKADKLTGTYHPGDKIEANITLKNDGSIPIDKSLSCTSIVFKPTPTTLKGDLSATSKKTLKPNEEVTMPLTGELTSAKSEGSYQGKGVLICKGNSSEGNVVPYNGDIKYDYTLKRKKPVKISHILIPFGYYKQGERARIEIEFREERVKIRSNFTEINYGEVQKVKKIGSTNKTHFYVPLTSNSPSELSLAVWGTKEGKKLSDNKAKIKVDLNYHLISQNLLVKIAANLGWAPKTEPNKYIKEKWKILESPKFQESLKGKYVWSFSPLAIDKMAENEEIIQMLAKQMTFDLYLDLTSMLSNPPKVKKMGMGPSLVDIISKINEMFKTKPYLEEQFSRLLQQVIEEDSNRIMMEGNAQPLKDAKDFNEFAKILLTLLDAGQQISSSSH